MIIPGKNDAEKHAWLGRNRLWPVADILLERGSIPPGLAAIAQKSAQAYEGSMMRQLEEERRVVSTLVEVGATVLVLKGALLAQTVYPRPGSRLRGDLDLLTEPGQLENVENALVALGYRRPMEIQSPMPMRQRLWTRSEDRETFSVDLHWDLRNHPALQGRLGFHELLRHAEPLPGLGSGALGMGRPHALLNASMHYFNDYADDRPRQWLFDKDLLWRAMTPNERAQTMQMSRECGLSGLLAESMLRARRHFHTPLTDSEIESLRASGAGQWCTGLVRANEARWSAYWFALRSEPDLRRKLLRIRRGLFPPASYMRQLYPDGSRLGILGLYTRRLRASLTD